jgi:hypothetical protein
MKKLFTLLALVLVCVAVHAKKYDLGLNLEKGKEYHQNTSSNMTISQNMQGMDIEIGMVVKADMVYKIIDIKDGNYQMEVSYKSMGMQMESPQGSNGFSSENAKEGDMMSTMLSKMCKRPFNVSMTKTGKIVEVQGLEGLFSGLFDGLDIAEPQKQQIVGQLEQSYGEDALKQNLEMATAIYPEKSVAVGDKWEQTGKIESNMSVTVSTTYELKEVGDDYYHIHGDSKMENDIDAPFMKQQGMDMRVELNGTMISEIKVDKKTGWIKEVNIKQDLSGNTRIKGNAQMPDGMNIPMKITGVTTITN